MKNFLIMAICSLSFAYAAAQNRAQPSDSTLTTNPVFVKNCAKCHGTNAVGRHFRGPSLKSDKVANASEDEIRQIIMNGKGHMPKYAGKLTSDEIDTLVQQINALNKK